MRFATVMVAILIAVSSVCAYAAADKKINGFALQLAPSQNAVQPGTPVWKTDAAVFVLVRTINNSPRTVHYSLTNPGLDWEMDVRDESGNAVSETEEFRKMKQDRKTWWTAGRNMLVELKPHETGQDTIAVSYFYNLKSVGKYFIQVRREFPEAGRGFVESSRLEMTIEQ